MELLFLYFYIVISICVTIFYAIDKFKAIKHAWRIPEKHLILLALLGPYGAFIGMILFRHKIRKGKFLFFVPLFMLLHILAYLYFANKL